MTRTPSRTSTPIPLEFVRAALEAVRHITSTIMGLSAAILLLALSHNEFPKYNRAYVLVDGLPRIYRDSVARAVANAGARRLAAAVPLRNQQLEVGLRSAHAVARLSSETREKLIRTLRAQIPSAPGLSDDEDLQADFRFLQALHDYTAPIPDARRILEGLLALVPEWCERCSVALRGQTIEAASVAMDFTVRQGGNDARVIRDTTIRVYNDPVVDSVFASLLLETVLRHETFPTSGGSLPFRVAGTGEMRDWLFRLIGGEVTLHKLGVWDEVRKRSLADAVGYLSGRRAESRRQVSILGLSLGDSQAIVLGPVLLALLACYVWLHIQRIMPTTAWEHGGVVLVAWPPLFPGAVGWISAVVGLVALPGFAVVALLIRLRPEGPTEAPLAFVLGMGAMVVLIVCGCLATRHLRRIARGPSAPADPVRDYRPE
jgi:hypothetical protein